MKTNTFPEISLWKGNTCLQTAEYLERDLWHNQGVYGYWLAGRNANAYENEQTEERIIAFGGPTSTWYVNYPLSAGIEYHYVVGEPFMTTALSLSQANVNFDVVESVFPAAKLMLGFGDLCLSERDENIYDFCFLESLSNEFNKVHSLLYMFFYNIKNVNISLYSDPEFESHKQIIFDIAIDADINKILDMEKDFFVNFVKAISRKKLKFFVIKCGRYESRRVSWFGERFGWKI